MQEIYYAYRVVGNKGFRLISDRGRRMSDIEVDVAISHREGSPLGSIKWHKIYAVPRYMVESGMAENINCLSGLVRDRYFEELQSAVADLKKRKA